MKHSTLRYSGLSLVQQSPQSASTEVMKVVRVVMMDIWGDVRLDCVSWQQVGVAS